MAGLVILLIAGLAAIAQTPDTGQYNMLHWRMIGPYRGGRTVGGCGVPQQPNVFYIGVNNGGIWKTNDFGRTWNPVFDKESTGSIGDIAVAPSNPEVIYAGSGEGLQRPDLSVGDGVYKSIDAGKTWQNTGIEGAQQIGGVAIDPRDENKVFVAALGHPYGPNTERGIYRTTNGGKSWEKVLYIDENTGAIQVAIDPQHPNTIFADLWAARQGPWENGQWQGPGSGLYKSTDGGTTWRKITRGLPTAENGLGRIGFCIAASSPNRMYACVDATKGGGVYKSDDGGESWSQENIDQRLWDRGSDFAECKADPINPDVVYIANVVAWKSKDAGKHWTAFRGAPGGDDYHRFWLNPLHPGIILLCSDQGAAVTVNNGQTFSSWYNQPTAQFYHVSTDNAFPYNVYGGQQESGSVGISSRGNDGEITFRDWHPVGVEEYGYIAPGPLNPNIIFGGKITRYNKLTGQLQDISPVVSRRGSPYHFVRTAPVIFSPVDPTCLYFAGNVLFKTTSGGNKWDVISPDLTRSSWEIPASVGIYTTPAMKTMPRRAVIYTVAPSHKTNQTIWVGTDDGLIQRTTDGGKHWLNITPPSVTSWNKVSMIDAGYQDDLTAYAAVNNIRLDDMHPHVYRTHDGGRHWEDINSGLPDNPVNTVRADPAQKGLLYAGTETAVYVSMNDGANWQPLQLNMPATSVRDLVVKDNDLVAGTHGRSFWILDGINPLRALAGATGKIQTQLFPTGKTYRVRWNNNTDTPLPQEEPAGENPPDGAMIDYYLSDPSAAEVSIIIKDASGKIIRQYSSADKPYDLPPVNIPLYWIRPQQKVGTGAGAHRLIWDLHEEPLDMPARYPIAAVFGQTAPSPTSPWVMPGKYTVVLNAGGKIYQQPLLIQMDPRVKTTAAALQQQADMSNTCYRQLKSMAAASLVLEKLNRSMDAVQAAPGTSLADSINAIKTAGSQLEAGNTNNRLPGAKDLSAALFSLMTLYQDSDMPVTEQGKAGLAKALADYNRWMDQYRNLTGKRMEALNRQLGGQNKDNIKL